MRFDNYHPAIELLYFAAVFLMTICFDHPIYVLISFVTAVIYSVYLRGKKAAVWNLLLLAVMAAYAIYYASYHHFGVTALKTNFIGNQITLEAFAYGMVTGCRLITVLMWGSCLYVLVTTDKIVFLLGRISPKLSLYVSILFRSVPQIIQQAKKIETAREGIYKGIRQGNAFERLSHTAGVLSILITWTIEDAIEKAAAMKCRGYSLKGRSAFAIYRFDNRDRSLVIAMAAMLTIFFMAVMFEQTTIYYDPVIVMNPVTPLSVVFYICYVGFLCLPVGLEQCNCKYYS